MSARKEHLRSDELLSDDDIWLGQLTPEPINENWLRCANALMIPKDTETEPSADCVKAIFYESLLHLDQNTAQPGIAYKRAEALDAMPKPLNFIRFMRMLHASRLDFTEVVSLRPEIWSVPVAFQHECITSLKDRLHSTARIEKLGSAATPAAVQKQREMYLSAVALGVPMHFVDRLLAESPRLARMAPSRIRVHARLLQINASAGASTTQIRELLQINPDKHLVAIDQGITQYTGHYIAMQSSGRTAFELRQQCLQILQELETSSALADRQLFRAFRRYHRATPVFNVVSD